MGVGQCGLENVEKLFAWPSDTAIVDRWRVFNMTLEDVFTLVGGRDHDSSSLASPSCTCCGRCCRCYMGKEETELEVAPIDLRAATAAVAHLITVAAPATEVDQVVAVMAKNTLLLLRGSWKSLAVIFAICLLPIIIIDHVFGGSSNQNNNNDPNNDDPNNGNSDPFGPIMLMSGFGIAPSLILPWLVVVAVQDNAGGLLELMVLQGLRIRNHVVGTFAYIFAITFATDLSILIVFTISSAPIIIDLSAGGLFLLLFALVVESIWTAAVAVMLTSIFRSTGMAAGVTGFFTVMLLTAALTIVMIKSLTSNGPCPNENGNPTTTEYPGYDNDDGFFSTNRPYPVSLNLAPFFGYFRALNFLGDTSKTGCRETTNAEA